MLEYNITYRQKDKGWQYIISFKDEEGKWRQRAKQGFRTRALAKIAADKRLEKLKKELSDNKKLNKEYEGITFKEFIDMYIKREELYREYNTILIYKNICNHFTSLDDTPLANITTLDIQKCVDEMASKCLAASTIKEYTNRLKSILNNAISPYKIILENPIQDIKFPINKQENKIKVFSKTELDLFLKEIVEHIAPQEHISTLLAATCGLRVGEILGLTWDNVDFVKRRLTINKQWKRLKHGIGFGELKSKNSYRVLPFSQNTLTTLKIYKKNNPTDIHNRVILYQSHSSLSSYLTERFRKQGYDITMHGLRHTYATTLIANGIDFKTVAKYMGHDIEQTIRTYSHVTSDMEDRAANVVEEIF